MQNGGGGGDERKSERKGKKKKEKKKNGRKRKKSELLSGACTELLDLSLSSMLLVCGAPKGRSNLSVRVAFQPEIFLASCFAQRRSRVQSCSALYFII